MSTCDNCTVSLICLMGRLDIKLYCYKCEHLWLFDGRHFPCDHANKPGVTLSVCQDCMTRMREERMAAVQKCLLVKRIQDDLRVMKELDDGTAHQSRRNRRDDSTGR